MVTRFFERLEQLFDPSRRNALNMSGTLLLHARLLAWQRRHAAVRAEHLLDWLLRIADVQVALTALGVHVGDTSAALERLMEDVPATALDESPPFDAEIGALVGKATVSGVCRTGALTGALAAALPAALTYLRAPLASVGAELGDLFDAELAHGAEGLTFEAWDRDLRIAAAVMQRLVDEKFQQTWWVPPRALFVAIVLCRPYAPAFKARGVDPKELLAEMTRSTPSPPAWVRPRPSAVRPSVAPHLYALLLRAERYAAEDASDVRLRHALAAIHDEKELAPWVERLVQ